MPVVGSLLPGAEGWEGILIADDNGGRLSSLATATAMTATTVVASLTTITTSLEALATSTMGAFTVTTVAKITTATSPATSITTVTAATASATTFAATAGFFEAVVEVEFLLGVSLSIALASCLFSRALEVSLFVSGLGQLLGILPFLVLLRALIGRARLQDTESGHFLRSLLSEVVSI
jgi:hypothetical protein